MTSAAVKAVVLVACSVAGAQETGGWLIRTGDPVSPSNPIATVELWAWFDDPTGERDAFALGDLDVVATGGVFRDPTVRISIVRGSATPGGNPGHVADSRVNDVQVGQVWGFTGLTGDTTNPILVWSAQWGTADFTPRTVRLLTEGTSMFRIGTSVYPGMNVLDIHPNGFQPGSGVIRVIPAPPAAAPLAVIILFRTRRRRR